MHIALFLIDAALSVVAVGNPGAADQKHPFTAPEAALTYFRLLTVESESVSTWPIRVHNTDL